jgi:hypothetical protein
VYVQEPDNDWRDPTVRAQNVGHGGQTNYTFGVEVEKAYLTITRGGVAITGQTNTVIVGEQVALSCVLSPGLAPITSFQWTIPGTYISNYVTSATLGKVYPLTNASDFTNSTITYYWVQGSGGSSLEVQCTAIVKGVTLTAKAKFNVIRPTASLTASITGAIALDNNYENNVFALHFGWVPAGIIFDYSTTASGTWNFAQLVNSYVARQRDQTDGTWYRAQGAGLDESFPYPTFRPLYGTSDSPGIEVIAGSSGVSLSYSFSMYLMFKPPGGIYVPIRKINWGFDAAATKSGTWGSPSGAPYVDPNDTDATSHPEWVNNIKRFRGDFHPE